MLLLACPSQSCVLCRVTPLLNGRLGPHMLPAERAPVAQQALCILVTSGLT